MSALVWQEPPAPQRVLIPWQDIARELRARPGQWALIHQSPSASTGKTHSSRMRRGGVAAMTPPGDWEVVNRGRNIYARFIGGGDAATESFEPYLPVASCGTEAGAKRHQRAGEPLCERCRQAANRAHVDRKRAAK